MEEQQERKRGSGAWIWAATVVILLIVVVWLAGGFDALFTTTEEEQELLTTEEKMPSTEAESETAPVPDPATAETPAKAGKPVTVNVKGETYYSKMQVPPSVVGGIDAISRKLEYPEEAKHNNVEGTVLIEAFLDEEGNVTNTRVLKGIGMGCDEAARKAVAEARYLPGQHDLSRVKSVVTIPVKFKLHEDTLQQ